MTSSTTETALAAAAAGAGLFDEVPALVTSAPPQHLVLKLKPRRRKVRFGDDVVDNEELCRKKSKCCCIYHRPLAFGESSDEEGAPSTKRPRPGDGPPADGGDPPAGAPAS